MSSILGAVCDDFYVSCRLFFKLDLELERETVLHFLDRVRKEYRGMRKLRRRDDRCLMLEEEVSEQSTRRWLRLDRGSLRFGQYGTADLDDVRKFGEFLLTQAPYHLSFSDLDFDHLEVVFGFDLDYRGNHDQLVAETLWGDHPIGGFLFHERALQVIDAQPYFGIALSPECDLQAYVEIKSRTTTYEVRSGSYESQPISVFLTVRKYWGVEHESITLIDGLQRLIEVCTELATDRIVPGFVNPLAAAIASRS